MSNYESHAGHRRSCAYTKAVDARVELYPAPHTRYKDKALIMHTSTTKLTGLGTISKVAYPKYKSLHGQLYNHEIHVCEGPTIAEKERLMGFETDDTDGGITISLASCH